MFVGIPPTVPHPPFPSSQARCPDFSAHQAGRMKESRMGVVCRILVWLRLNAEVEKSFSEVFIETVLLDSLSLCVNFYSGRLVCIPIIQDEPEL